MNIISHLNLVSSMGEAMGALVIVSGLVGFAVTILWLIIGWRAMRAHERLAELASLHIHAAKTNSPQKRADAEQMKRYQTFMNEVEGAKDLPFAERQTMFKSWMLDQ